MIPLRLRRLFAPLLIASSLAAATPALAEGGFFDMLGSIFGGRHAPSEMYGNPVRIPKPKPKPKPKPALPAAASTLHAPRPAPSFIVAVIGDSQAGMLAQGLQEAFASDARIAILNKSREDTGLVREDFYDWRAGARALLDGPDHIDLAVIQIGINDNQKIRLGGDNNLEAFSKPFNELYAKRVEELAAVFREKNVPLVWVGLPIMRSDTLSNAALVLNDIDREYASAQGAHFVDLWEAFSDANSVYKAFGPDVNGAIVRLRASDGVHFNLAGARKAAHFVEPELRHAIEAKLQAPPPAETAPPTTPAPGGLAPEGQPATPAVETPAAPPPKPIAGRIQPLTEPAVAPGGGLAALPPRAAPPPQPVGAMAQPGRADDFSWPKN